jgi:four helix bundle protein
MIYNLEKRTNLYGKAIIAFCIRSSKNDLLKPLVNQLIRSGTSIGANYMEANQAASKKDFRNKIKIAQKEANETKYWLSLLGESGGVDISECRRLWKEAHELLLIFSRISSSSK